jgi:hypothetical protein
MADPESPETEPAAEPEEAETGPGSALGRRLQEAGTEELLALLAEHAERLEVPEVRQALRNPYATAEVVAFVAGQTRLLSWYEVRRELASHPKAPEALALRFVVGLYWRDLMAAGLDIRLHPRVRRAADDHLAARLPQLATGEKISLARRASPTLLAQLRQDPSPMVITALLDNPRLTEGILAPLVHSPRALAPILKLIAEDRRWGVRHGIRAALAKNPRTPLDTALKILPTLGKIDLKGVATAPGVPEAVAQRARLLLGER